MGCRRTSFQPNGDLSEEPSESRGWLQIRFDPPSPQGNLQGAGACNRGVTCPATRRGNFREWRAVHNPTPAWSGTSRGTLLEAVGKCNLAPTHWGADRETFREPEEHVNLLRLLGNPNEEPLGSVGGKQPPYSLRAHRGTFGEAGGAAKEEARRAHNFAPSVSHGMGPRSNLPLWGASVFAQPSSYLLGTRRGTFGDRTRSHNLTPTRPDEEPSRSWGECAIWFRPAQIPSEEFLGNEVACNLVAICRRVHRKPT